MLPVQQAHSAYHKEAELCIASAWMVAAGGLLHELPFSGVSDTVKSLL